ncbi:hypothetical protein RFI_00642 [Reticulomyxa filosa]|uniref:UBP34/UBP24/USP9X/USP9Y-like ARM repeat region domain-containing protein n=1 Tax=Reticulomyxa filosa TaxID=46433 RepID=X6PFI1_RETFI|nr:hypothetical protein RFI_00642 [Reticulomyxa filosa]|eukprot:ETO36417.1 hypothetical protein RFI_00642 [Reticulomyxa filosa]
MNEERLASLLEFHDFVGVVFGADANPQLIQKSILVLKFLASAGKLSDMDLTKVWESSQGKHESHVETIYRLLFGIANTLSKDKSESLLRQIVEHVPLHTFDLRLLDLWTEITQTTCPSVTYVPQLDFKHISSYAYNTLVYAYCMYTYVKFGIKKRIAFWIGYTVANVCSQLSLFIFILF